MNKWIKTTLIVPGLALMVAGCTNEGGQVSETTEAVTEVVENDTVGATSEVAEPNKDVRAFVRVAHLVPEAGAVSLQVDGKTIAEGATFGNVTDYVGLGGEKTDFNAEGDHKFTVVGADGRALGEATFDLDQGEDVTLLVSGPPSDIKVTPIAHTGKPMSGQARLALIYSPDLGPKDGRGPTISAMLDDKALPNKMAMDDDGDEYEDVAYQNVAPGSHTIKIMSEGAPEVSRAQNMEAGRTYTALVYKGAKGTAEMKIMEDKFGPTLIRTETVTTEAVPDGTAATAPATE